MDIHELNIGADAKSLYIKSKCYVWTIEFAVFGSRITGFNCFIGTSFVNHFDRLDDAIEFCKKDGSDE